MDYAYTPMLMVYAYAPMPMLMGYTFAPMPLCPYIYAYAPLPMPLCLCPICLCPYTCGLCLYPNKDKAKLIRAKQSQANSTNKPAIQQPTNQQYIEINNIV